MARANIVVMLAAELALQLAALVSTAVLLHQLALFRSAAGQAVENGLGHLPQGVSLLLVVAAIEGAAQQVGGREGW